MTANVDDKLQSRAADPMLVAVIALGITQITAWGTSLYALGVLGLPIVRDTGWSKTLVFGGLTLGLLSSAVISTWAGRLIDRRGGRVVMTAGSALMGVALALLAMVHGEAQWLAAWVVVGIAMRLTLYDAAFAALAQVTPARARRAISYLTLFGGVASTIFWPIGYALDAAVGWRATLMIFAALNLLLCAPLHWFGLRRRDALDVPEAPTAAPTGATAAAAEAPLLTGRDRLLALILFGWIMSVSAFVYGAMAAHLVTAIAAGGVSAATAVWLASLKGIAQTTARFGDIVLGKNLHPVNLGRITLAILPLAFAMLLLGGASFYTALAFTILFGAANGLSTIVRGAVPLALFGTRGYGEILGLLATPYLILNAVAPLIFAMLAETISVTAANVLLAVFALLAWASMEVMAAWYRRRRPATA
ncbi:MAG: MFS transporter [Hyphomicrobiales bacterium]|nr:MFS transporter [Hyphomicrobiales bacterium]